MKKSLSILLVFLWLFVVYGMSSFDADISQSQSNIVVNLINELFNISNIDTINTISFIVRKTAHFCEYLILGILMYNMFHNFNKKTYIAIIICILCAICDELYQSLIPGRSTKLLDIIIDSSGSTLGVYTLYLFIKYKPKLIKQRG